MSFLLNLLGNWRTILLGSAAAAALALYAWGSHEKHRADAAETRARAAVAQASLDKQTTQIADKAHVAESSIREKASHAETQVRSAPGSETPIPPDRRSILCAALAGVRGEPVCDSEPDHPAKPPGAVQGTDNADANAG